VRRLLPATIASVLLIGLTASVATATKPANTCGAKASGYFVVDVDTWWEITVEGFAAEGNDSLAIPGGTSGRRSP
jgi:hypothetical protein